MKRVRLSCLVLLLLLSVCIAARTSEETEVHDIAITWVDVDRPIMRIYTPFATIDATAENWGNASETFNVTFYVKSYSRNITLFQETVTVQDLAAGQMDYPTAFWVQIRLRTSEVFPRPWIWPPDSP